MSKKKEIRENFRNVVFARDKYTCRGCDSVFTKETAEEFLDAHHITDRNDIINGGYVIENGITLCKKKCHEKAEQFHVSDGKDHDYDFHPSDLYKKIGSSKELAIEKSKLLNPQNK